MSSRFDKIIGHERIVRVLKDAAAHPGNAYLFFGPEGVGKRTTARIFAAELLKLDEGKSLESHPDFIRLEREEGSKLISVDAARELVVRTRMSSAAGGHTAVLIEDAERLSESATNALLKAVEEPAKGVVYLFLAEEASRLPVTLRSRLAPLAFHGVPTDRIAAWLAERGVDAALSKEAAGVSLGSPGVALRIAEQPDEWEAKRNRMQEVLSVLAHGKTGEKLFQIEELSKACESEEDSDAAWRETIRLLMAEWRRTDSKDEMHARIGIGLARAWNMVGTSVSPRYALEWTAAEPYLIGKRFIPSFLNPTYL